MITQTIQNYAEQCEDQRLSRQFTRDALNYVELETDELDETEIRFIKIHLIPAFEG